ncbi:hypothetical protein CBS147333_7706 [Penicillium roqueforti]|nr:hypothetical protein CBS147333_7706 [Penicillium roqueforti]KAI3194631.1 hypothetical protein CBS147311_8536 [Penicillium roqueforti]KAI3263902.1 hypothetical protein CBS147308_8326 [Penicillium roqueforti]KAI3283597.1 hypothetical protein DTO003C3_8509 [Penicillium roqueforti]KAI3284987.1 hypothetical protein DTO002I6_8892 [Penicillium roqueforti]
MKLLYPTKHSTKSKVEVKRRRHLIAKVEIISQILVAKAKEAAEKNHQNRQALRTKLAPELNRRKRSNQLSSSDRSGMRDMDENFEVLSPRDVRSFSFILEPTTKKRFCRKKIELWLPKNPHEITMDFSRPGMALLRPQSLTYATSGPAKQSLSSKKSSTTKKSVLDAIAEPRISTTLSIGETTQSGYQGKKKQADLGLNEVNPIQKFKPYASKTIIRNLSESLRELLTKPLSKSDLKFKGSIYVFWQQGNFGYLKIGRSANVRRRFKEWSDQCKKDMGIHFPDFTREASDGQRVLEEVAHICRVEALVHLELLEHRKIEEKCPGCSRNHIEWFQVSDEKAIAVAQKWMAWMRTEPYENRGTGGEEKWVLKAREMERLGELSQPLFPKLAPESQVREERLASLRPRASSSTPWRDGKNKLGRRSI